MKIAFRPKPILAAIVVAGALLRLALADYSMWFDEFASLAFAEQPLSRLWSGWMVRETNPPLFYALLHGWLALGARSLLALRVLPIGLGVLGIVILAAIAQRAYGHRAAWAVAGLASLSAQHIYYSHTLRAYILAFDGVALSLLGLVILAGKPASPWKGAALYALGAVVAIHSHTTLFLWLPIAMLGFGVVLLPELRQWDTGLARALLIANAGIALAGAWWLRMTIVQLRVSHGNIDWIPPLGPSDSLQLIAQSAFLVRGEEGWAVMLTWLFVGLTVVAAVRTWSLPATRLIAAIGLAALVLLCAAHLYRPILLERTVFWLSLFPLLLLAGWLGRIERPLAAAGVASVLALLLAVNLAEVARVFQRQDWLPSMRRIAAEPGGALLVEHEALGAVSQEACKVAFPQRECPFPIVTMRSASTGNVWARGLYEGPVVEPAIVHRAFAPEARIFALRQGDLDVVADTAALGAPVRPTPSRAWPEGPYGREAFEIAPIGRNRIAR